MATKEKKSTKKKSKSEELANKKGKVSISKPTKKVEGKIIVKKDAAKDLQDLFEDGLKDIYWAEKALKKELPKMEKNATSADLKYALASHLAETEEHIKRLESVFKSLDKKAVAEKCDAMDGLS